MAQSCVNNKEMESGKKKKTGHIIRAQAALAMWICEWTVLIRRQELNLATLCEELLQWGHLQCDRSNLKSSYNWLGKLGLRYLDHAIALCLFTLHNLTYNKVKCGWMTEKESGFEDKYWNSDTIGDLCDKSWLFFPHQYFHSNWFNTASALLGSNKITYKM